MLTGYQLSYNSAENIACYAAGANGVGLEATPIPCAGDGGVLLGIEWAIPCSNNGGASLTGFSYQKATSSTKPRADAVKVITVQNSKNGGSYGRWLVPDSYTTTDFVEACCAGCEPIAEVTVPAPILLDGECVLAAPTIPGCVYYGDFYVQALTGTNDTYTLTAIGYDADGNAVTFAPTTVSAATPALLAAAAQTAWASEMGSGTFTATGNVIAWTATIVKTLGASIVQSDAA